MIKKKKFQIMLSIITVISIISAFLIAVPATASTPVPPPTGITYYLYATDGYWKMADGTSIYAYGYIGGREGSTIQYVQDDGTLSDPITVPAATPGALSAEEELLSGHAQFPGPMIWCAEGDIVTIVLKNLGVTNPSAPNDPHTVHLHAVDVDAANDGVPETSVATIPANSDLPGAGNLVYYTFKASRAGTYFYHCHQEADIHVTMGMYGALIIYNRGEKGATSGPGSAGKLFNFNYAKDYVMLLSETDILQHQSEATSGDYNPVDFKPQYFFINGLSFPNTVHAGLTSDFDFTNWLTAHPGYETLISGSVSKKEKVLVRMINMGFAADPMHCHGFHPKVLGSDQRAWYWGQNPITGLGLEKNTINVGSGEEYDLLFDFSTQKVFSTYNVNTQSRYNPETGEPVVNTATDSPPIPEPATGEDYIGGPQVRGAVGMQGINSQLFPFHNHDDYKATNNGAYPGGMFTLIMPTP